MFQTCNNHIGYQGILADAINDIRNYIFNNPGFDQSHFDNIYNEILVQFPNFSNCNTEFTNALSGIYASDQALFSSNMGELLNIRQMFYDPNVTNGYGCDLTRTKMDIITFLSTNYPNEVWRIMLRNNNCEEYVRIYKNTFPTHFIEQSVMYDKALLSAYQQNNNIYGGNYGGLENYFVNMRNNFGQSLYDQIVSEFLNQSSIFLDSMMLSEWHIYGSSRIGIYNANLCMATRRVKIEEGIITQQENTNVSYLSYSYFTISRGAKRYELTNHLGNVLTVVSDKKIPVCTGEIVSFFLADVVSATDYSPFGAPLQGRTWQASEYRFSFNGQEKDDEVSGAGNTLTAEFWEYDARLGRRWNVDPIVKENESGYSTFSCNPIVFIDPNGDNAGDYYKKDGTHLGSDGQTDNRVYTAESVTKNESGDVIDAKNKKELSVTHSTLKAFAGTVIGESSGNKTESYAIASAIKNLSDYQGTSILETISKPNAMYGYGTPYDGKNGEHSMEAAINALSGGKDYSNGAIRWDGFDLAVKGWDHIKSRSQGIGISKSHLETFKKYWTTGDNLINTSGNKNAVYNSSFLMNGNADFTYSAATKGMWKGMVLYTSSAAYGGTLFWKATPTFNIKGVNINSQYEKIKGSKNKPL